MISEGPLYYRISRVRDLGGVVFYHAHPFSNERDQDTQEFVLEARDHPEFDQFKRRLSPGSIISTIHSKDPVKNRYLVQRILYLNLAERFSHEYPNRPIKDKGIVYKEPVLSAIGDPAQRNRYILCSQIRAKISHILGRWRFREFITPILEQDATGSAARCFDTVANYNGKKYSLRTSHEFPGKKLLMMGLDKVAVRGPCFRNQDLGPRHSFEYEGLELYYLDNHQHPQKRLETLRSLIEQIFRECWYQIHHTYDYGGHDLREPWPVLTWSALVDQYQLSHEQLQKKIKAGDPIFPKLFHVTGLPRSRCPLAWSQDDLAFNVQTYIDGVQVFDSYLEEYRLEALKTNWADSIEKNYVDADFLHNIKLGLPPATGLGLGIDRLCMVVLQPLYPGITLRDIKPFPFY